MATFADDCLTSSCQPATGELSAADTHTHTCCSRCLVVIMLRSTFTFMEDSRNRPVLRL